MVGLLNFMSFMKGVLIGDKVGIIPFTNFLYTLRVDNETPEKLIELALREESKNWIIINLTFI